MSVESGFKTFRGSDGLWENYPVEQVASHEGWNADPELVTGFYNMLRKKLYGAQPNEGHRLIQSLERMYDVTVITQNVDNLHERAGSSKVIHLHGELTNDGSLLRPFIVFFGEAVPMISAAAEQASQADVFVIVGTSLNVYPAAGLVQYVRPSVPVYIIDPEPVTAPSRRDVTHIAKGASEGMKELCGLLGAV